MGAELTFRYRKGYDMKIYTCNNTFEDMMCCLYVAWAEEIKIGHDQIALKREPVMQQTLFDEYIHVDYDEELFTKVVRSIRKKLSYQIYIDIYYVAMSREEDALNTIYDYLHLAFKKGAEIRRCYTEPVVMRMMELRRSVGNEVHHFQEFVRFVSLDSRLYIAHVEPKHNIAFLVANIFAERMPSENYMIVDDNRQFAVIHPKDGDLYIQQLTAQEFGLLQQAEYKEDEYTDMWRGFFQSIAIRQRENPKCQRNLFPVWMRKHATEFMDGTDFRTDSY